MNDIELLELLDQFAAISEAQQAKKYQEFKNLCASLASTEEKTPVDLLTLELFNLCLADTEPASSVNRSPFLSNVEKTRAIGEALHQAGGLELMLSVCALVPTYDQRELDMAWNGIGGWIT